MIVAKNFSIISAVHSKKMLAIVIKMWKTAMKNSHPLSVEDIKAFQNYLKAFISIINILIKGSVKQNLLYGCIIKCSKPNSRSY